MIAFHTPPDVFSKDRLGAPTPITDQNRHEPLTMVKAVVSAHCVIFDGDHTLKGVTHGTTHGSIMSPHEVILCTDNF